MSGAWNDLDTPVRALPGGVIRVGPARAAAAGQARVFLPGATALVDPMTPNCPPTLEISDVPTASDVVESLVGTAVVDALLELDRHPRKGTDLVRTGWGSGMLDLQRLGHLLWLARFAPVPVAQDVLGAEIVAAAGAARPLLEDPIAVGEALADLAEPMVTALATALDRGVDGRAVAALRAAAESGAVLLPLDHAAVRILAELGGASAIDAGGTGRAALLSLVPLGADHAATPEPGLFAGRFTAEWTRTALGRVCRDEDAVEYTAEVGPTGEVALWVGADAPADVSAVPGAPTPDVLLELLTDPLPSPYDGLVVSVHTPAFPLPLAQARMHAATPGRVTAELRVPGAPGRALALALRRDTLTIDVHAEGTSFAPTAGHRVAEAARRWTARAWWATRLAGGVDVEAAPAWRQAQLLWASTAADGVLAEHRRRLCAAWATAGSEQVDAAAVDNPDLASLPEPVDVTTPVPPLTATELLVIGR